MGNKQGYHEVALELGLNEEEGLALHSLFSSLAAPHDVLTEEAVSEYFASRSAEGFGQGLFSIMAAGTPPVTFDKFARTGEITMPQAAVVILHRWVDVCTS